MDDKNRLKLGLIIIMSSITASLILLSNSLDPFAPKHIAIISEITSTGFFKFEIKSTRHNPAFYSLGSIIYLLVNTHIKHFLFIPLQILPFSACLYILLYKISYNEIISSIAVASVLITGSYGSQQLLFWPHGIGRILYLTILLVLYIFVKKGHSYRTLLLLTVALSTVTISSYNYSARIFFVSFSFIGFSMVVKKGLNKNIPYTYNQVALLLLPLSVSSVFFITFSEFFEYVILFFIQYAGLNSVVDLIARFSTMWFQSSGNLRPIDRMLINRPTVVTYMMVIKYGALYGSVLLFGILFLKRIINRRITFEDVFLSSILIGIGVFMILRTLIGKLPIGYIYVPSILVISYLSHINIGATKIFDSDQFNTGISNLTRILTYLIIVTILLIGLIQGGIYTHNGQIEDNRNSIETKLSAGDWSYKNIRGDKNTYSDEYTRGIFILNGVSKNYFRTEGGHGRFPIMEPEVATTLAGINDSDIPNGYLAIDYKQTKVNLQAGVHIRSWVEWKSDIQRNRNMNLVYSNDGIDIYEIRD